MSILSFTRDTDAPAPDNSTRYWRAFARSVFERHPHINVVRIARSGRKTDLLPRGVRHGPPGEWLVVASTGGKWGKSRREYAPVK